MKSTREAPPLASRDLSVPHSSEKILEAAESLFAAAGYSGVGMRQLATTVGLSKSSLFHHFPTKLGLYAAVLDRVLERIERGLGADDGAGQDPATRLDQWIEAIVGVLAEDAPTARLMMRALVDEEPFPALALSHDPADRERMPFEIRLARILDRFRRLLEAGITEGSFRPLSVGDAIQSTIGALVFHFASGDLGEALIGEPIFSRAAVTRRRREVSDFIRRGLLA
jgi:AcrR family transcriptional regulator